MEKKTSPLIIAFSVFILLVALTAAILGILVAVGVLNINFIEKEKESTNGTIGSTASNNISKDHYFGNNRTVISQNTTRNDNTTSNYSTGSNATTPTNITTKTTTITTTSTISSSNNTTSSRKNTTSSSKNAISTTKMLPPTNNSETEAVSDSFLRSTTEPSSVVKPVTSVNTTQTNPEESDTFWILFPVDTFENDTDSLPRDDLPVAEIEITEIVYWESIPLPPNPENQGKSFPEPFQPEKLIPGVPVTSSNVPEAVEEMIPEQSLPVVAIPSESEADMFSDDTQNFPGIVFPGEPVASNYEPGQSFIPDYDFPGLPQQSFVPNFVFPGFSDVSSTGLSDSTNTFLQESEPFDDGSSYIWPNGIWDVLDDDFADDDYIDDDDEYFK